MLTAGRLLGVLVLLKAVDVGVRGPAAGAALWVLVVAVLATAGGLLVAGTDRAGWWVLLLGCALAVAEQPLELRLQHTVLLGWAALGAVVAARDAERLLLWRVLLSALYGVAAVAKLNESYLGGDTLALALTGAPLGSGLLPLPPPAVLITAGVALIAVEVVLAVVPWVPRLHRVGLLVAVAFHVAAVPMAGSSPLVSLRLVVFGGTSLVLLAACTGRLAPSGGGRPVRH